MAVTTIRGGRQISDGTIPYADIQNVTANTILGNNTGSAASIQEIALASSTLLGRAATGNIAAITLGTGLSFSGTSIVLSSNTISGVALGSNLFSLTAGTGLSGTAYNGSAALTWTLATAYGDSINPYGSKTANYVLAAPNGTAGVPTFRALVAADIPALSYVTSVALSLPNIFTVSGSPVTSSGTLTGTLASQTANTFFAAPNGSAGSPTFRSIVAADIPTLNQNTTGSAGSVANSFVVRADSGTTEGTDIYTFNGSAAKNINIVAGTNISITKAAGQWTINTSATTNTGTVTSVALSLPGIFSVSGSPVTTSGTLTATLASQTANTVFAAPNGSAGAPTFRSLVAADIPALSYVTSVSGTGTVSGLTLSGTVTSSGSLTLGGTLTLTAANVNAVGAITNSTSGSSGNVSISNLNTQQVTVALAAGSWYTIAANAGDRASAKFTVTDPTSGLHQSIHFYATAHFGTATGAKISVVSNTYYAGPPVTGIRIMTGGTYDGAMVQIYAASACTVTVSIYDNQQTNGWVIKSGIVSTTNPGTVATFASLTTNSAQVDVGNSKSFSVTDNLYVGGATTQYLVWHAGNDGTGSTLDADLLDGNHASAFYLASNPNNYTSNTGTVTSVGLSLPGIFTVSGSPVTTSGTLSATLASQTANTIFAAPNGSAGSPTFRALVAADIPSLSYLPLSGGTLTGALTISNGADLNLRAATSSSDSGDIVFQDGAGAELHRLWNGTNTLNYRTNAGTTYELIHTGNDTDFVRTRSTVVNTNSSNFNSFTTAGTYQVSGNGTWTGSTNGPTSAYQYGQLVVTVNGSIVTQFYYSHSTNGHWVRSKFNASDWQSWQKMWTDANLTNNNQLSNGSNYITAAQTYYIGTTQNALNRSSGAQTLSGVSIDGNAATATNVNASGITNQTGMWTSNTRPGPYRLYRRDDDSNYSVQTSYSADRSGYWSLRGYSADTYHAGCYVAYSGYADSAGSATNALRIVYADGPRDLSDRLPNSFTRTVNFDFVTSGTVGGTGNYAGVMTYSPWDGTTGSTGDSSYQLAFMNGTSLNGAGLPSMRLRKGIDTTWGSWYTLLHDGNVGSYAITSLSGETLAAVTARGASTTAGITVNGTLTVGNTTSSYIYMIDTDETSRYIHCNSGRIGFLTSSSSWGSYCDNSGNWTSVGDITAYSDARVKENVSTIENALEKTLALRGVTYTRKDTEDKSRKVGVIAQEIQEILPEVVSEQIDGMLGVSYGNIVGVLIEAIKEQQTQIEDLKKQIEYLVENSK